jgi:hypothetical protein
VHLAYLKEVYNAFLSIRKCTHTSQCQAFAGDAVDNYRCIIEDDFGIPWFGAGDDPAAISTSLIGVEGGCLCTQGFSVQPCNQCREGYGPTTIEEQWAYRQFFFGANVTILPDEPLLLCTLPWTTDTTRQTGVCGGRGNITVNTSVEVSPVHVFTPGNKTRRCRSLLIRGGVFLLDEREDDFAVDVIRYRSVQNASLLLDVFGQRIFYDLEEWSVRMVEGLTMEVATPNGGSARIMCRPIAWSTTHAVNTTATDTGQIVIVKDSNWDFWLAKIFRF